MQNQIAIRRVTVADAPVIQRYVSDDRVADTCNVPHPYPEDGAITWVRRVTQEGEQGQRYPFAIEYGGDFAGVVDLELVGRPEGTAELGYWIPSHLWNRGIATEACRLAVGFGFGETDLSCLTSACLVRNPASGRVLQKNGFRQTDVVTETATESRFRGQRWQVYRLTRSEWEGGICERLAPL